ncbi:hypothetical protein [Kineococcus xinjiangensis]|uniref:hypothetical protein n=1 Tax=Kineococcus xinjiangensis TaxID=512762 RepID=UPI0011B0CC9A|nr:hypothetical protein [Kineococcus xinjiangensis]
MVGTSSLGPGLAIPLVAAPFLLVAAWPLPTSDPLGVVGVLTLAAVVLVGTAVLSAATAAVHQALRGRGSPPSPRSS